MGLAINREFLDRIQTLRQSFTTEVRIRIIWWPTSAPRSSRHTTPTPQYISKRRVVSRREKSSVSTPQPRYFFRGVTPQALHQSRAIYANFREKY